VRAFVTLASSVLLAGCDGSLTVTGFVPEADCELTLWHMSGPLWQKQVPTLRRKATVSRTFEVEWEVGGLQSPHWLEIACPTGETFKSHELLVGHAGNKVDLGRVRLKPPSTPPATP
jgi:hypothetical protein